jgi:predicted nucleic acid-binding protein
MRTAIDTDILSVLWGGGASATRVSATLDAASNAGSVVICAMVFVEVQGYRGVTRDFLERFLDSTRINVDWGLDRPVWQMAAERFGTYADRSRRLGSGQPTYVPADFIIAAHATLHADRLITLDQRRYRADFPELTLVEL